MEQKWTKMATIERTHSRSVEAGLGLSKHLIRQLCKSGVIKPVIVGKSTFLISWDNLLAFLDNPQETIKPEQPKSGEVRPIPERLTAVR